jgi:predicted GTPase
MTAGTTRDYFYVETSHDGQRWSADTSGARVMYEVPAEELTGLSWARQLAAIHPHVRVKRIHEVTEPVSPASAPEGKA